MSEITLNETQFQYSISRIKELLNGTPLILYLEKYVEDQEFGWNSAYFLYILGYEFPETILIIGDQITFITRPKKSKILSQLSNIKIIEKTKDYSDSEEIKKQIQELYGTKFFTVQKIKNKIFNEYLKDFEFLDFENHKLFEIKDRKELEKLIQSSECSNFLLKKMIEIIIGNRSRITNSELSIKMENMLNLKMSDFPHDQGMTEFIYKPFVQSEDFDISKFPENPLENFLIKETLTLVQLGIRYKTYSSEIGRSLLINQEYEMKEIYENLFKLREFILNKINEKINDEILTNELIKESKEYFKSLTEDKLNDDLIYSIGIMQNEGIPERIKKNSSIVLNLILEEYPLILKDTIVIEERIISIPKDNVRNYIATVESSRRRSKRFVKRIKMTEKNITRNENQKEMMSKLIEEMIEYYKKKTDQNGSEMKVEELEGNYISYERENLLLRGDKLGVDLKKKTILIPIYGYLVPFHIFYIKSISKTSDDALKINFKENKVKSLRSLTYKSTKEHTEYIFREISEMRRAFINHEDMVVAQEDLKEIHGRKIVLTDVFMRTDSRFGKKKSSNLEIHENGFRFYDESPVDILFKNVKYLIFQEAGNEDRVMIHLSLHSPLMIGKKTSNIQFYRDTSSNTAVDTNKVGRNEDYIENMMEQENQIRKDEYNAEFKRFISKIEENTNLRAEIPFHEQGFNGVPHKDLVFISPTENLLVNIFEFPPTIISLSEIEVVNFERVSVGVRTFDMVIIFKNKTYFSIQAIDHFYLEPLKDFLNQRNIVYIETIVNLNWPNLIKVILKDPIEFYEQGGWYELQPIRDEEEEESSSTISEEEEDEDDSESVTFVESEDSVVESEECDDYVEESEE